MKFLTTIKYEFIFVLLIVVLTSCEGEHSLSHTTTDIHINLSVNRNETEYNDDNIYPFNASFILEIVPVGNQSLIEIVKYNGTMPHKNAAIHYLSYDFPKSIRVTDGSDINLEPLFFHFERSFDLKSGRKFLVAFDLSGIKTKTDLWFTIDQHHFGNQPIKINLNDLAIYQS